VADSDFLVGVHVSIAGHVADAVTRAAALGCTTFQIFSSNPRGWRRKPLAPDDAADFRARAKRLGFGAFFVHMPYLPNVATPDDELWERSVAALGDALGRTAALGGRYVVTHMGSHKGAGLDFGLPRAAAALERALAASRGSGVMILMEDAAGKSGQLGTRFEELSEIYRLLGRNYRRRVGLCIDTCHSHAMGYNLSARGDGLERILAEVAAVIGVAKIKLLHLNDAKGECGSRLDRHEHIGRGTIGRAGFRKIINHPALRHLPMVLETPPEDRWDRKNLRAVRRLRAA